MAALSQIFLGAIVWAFKNLHNAPCFTELIRFSIQNFGFSPLLFGQMGSNSGRFHEAPQCFMDALTDIFSIHGVFDGT
jgi:hypothetical protein